MYYIYIYIYVYILFCEHSSFFFYSPFSMDLFIFHYYISFFFLSFVGIATFISILFHLTQNNYKKNKNNTTVTT